MERTTSEKIRLGIFVLTGTILLVVASYLIGNRQNMFGSNFTIHAVFNNVSGLQKGNNVRYAGVQVGTVKSITMLNDSTISVGMIIQESMASHIKEDAIATIGSDGLVGSMIVNVVPGNGQAPLVSPGDTIRSYSRIGAEDMLSTLNKTNENAALLTSDLLKVTDALTSGKGTLGKLLNDTAMAEELQATLQNLNWASRGVARSVERIDTLLHSEAFNGSVAHILLNDKESGERLTSLIEKLENTGAHLEKVSIQLDSTIKAINREGGTVDFLASDTTFVNNLNATMENLNEGTARFNENMEAMKHSFLTRGYFKKQEKEARKEAKNQSNR